VRGERDNIGQNCEDSCYYFSVTVMLFIVIIKYVTYISPQCVCVPVPPGSLQSIQKK
jgi:hypothetical protein